MTAVLSTTLFADPVTQVDAADLHIVAATDAADATARSVPQVTTVAGQTYGENDAIAVAVEVVVDGRTLTPGLWYWPVATASADINALREWNPSTAAVQKGTTAEKLALGTVPVGTPFFDIDLGRLQRWGTLPASTTTFNVVKGAGPLPQVASWVQGASLSHFSGRDFKLSLDPASAADNATLEIPEGVATRVYVLAAFVTIAGAATNTSVGGSFMLLNTGGVLVLGALPAQRKFSNGGAVWVGASYNTLTDTQASPLAIDQAAVDRVLVTPPGTPGWVDVQAAAGGGAVTLSGTTMPAAGDFSLFVLTATDGGFAPGVYMSNGTARHQVFTTP